MSVANASQPVGPPIATASPVVSNPDKQPATSTATLNPAPHQVNISREIPLARIVPSKTNPRKTFAGPEFDDLVASVAAHGVLQPVLVRENEGWKTLDGEIEYQLVCGERRYRASLKAGLKAIPAVVRELSDAEAMEIQIVENLQRQDVSPLEESGGYTALFKQMQGEQAAAASRQQIIAAIAQKIGKSVRYVYARMKLGELHEDVKKALAAGEIPASHADELARLQPADQKKALKEFCFEREWIDGKDVKVLVSVRAFKSKLARGFTRNLFAAPWPHDDAALLPIAGACSACPKNTANQPDGDAKARTCIDLDCYGKKEAAFVQIQLDKVKQETGAKDVVEISLGYSSSKPGATRWSRYDWDRVKKVEPGSCNSAQTAFVAASDDAEIPVGTVKTFCSAHACKVHNPGGAKRNAGSGSASSKASAADKAKAEAEKKERQAGLAAVFAATLDKVKDISGAALDLALDRAFFNSDLYGEYPVIIAGYFGWKTDSNDLGLVDLENAYRKAAASMTVTQKSRLLLALLHADHWLNEFRHGLDPDARKLGIDPKAVRAKALAAAKAAAQTSAQAPPSAARKPTKASGSAKAKSPAKAQAKGKQGGKR